MKRDRELEEAVISHVRGCLDCPSLFSLRWGGGAALDVNYTTP
jgi:hypothetical protein